jgi:hypothetical protein
MEVCTGSGRTVREWLTTLVGAAVSASLLAIGGWAVSAHRTIGEHTLQIDELSRRQDVIVNRGTTRLDQLVNRVDDVLHMQTELSSQLAVVSERLHNRLPPPPER